MQWHARPSSSSMPTSEGKLAKQSVARSKFPLRSQAIWAFLAWKWGELDANYDPNIHDRPTLEEASKIFGLPAEEIKNIWIEIDAAGMEL